MQDKFYFRLDKNGYSDDFNNFRVNLEKCAMYIFAEYSSLDKLYDKTILPILNGNENLPDVGADWIFIDLALCKLVNPTNFDKLKQIILSHIRKMYERKEHIFHYLEYNKI